MCSIEGAEAPSCLCFATDVFILVACSMVFMAAVVRSSKTLLVLGGIILLEEIYETGVALLILRAERAAC